MQLDAYRERDDNSRTPYRCRALIGNAWSFLRTKAGKVRRFSSLKQAGEAGQRAAADDWSAPSACRNPAWTI